MGGRRGEGKERGGSAACNQGAETAARRCI